MKLDENTFAIDPPAAVERLAGFIRARMLASGRKGIIVPFSGGLDSSTVLLLSARAVGAENVTALLLPERQGNPEAEMYARRVAGQYGIRTVRRDISPVLSRLGVYRFALSWIPFRPFKEWAARKFLAVSEKNPFLEIVHGTAGHFERAGFAKFNTKHRVRAVVAFMFAEEHNLLVAGCAHKSEDMLGLFVKFGVDDLADIMPLKNLYRSHILQIAAELGVPEEIIRRTPNPDIIPGISDKYMDLLGLHSETLDLILVGFENGMDDEDIAGQLDLRAARVAEIRDLVQRTEHMRNPSQTLYWD